MAEQDKVLAEKAFWNSRVTLVTNGPNNAGKNENDLSMSDLNRLNAKEYAARIAQQQALERQKDNLKLLAMMALGFLAICLIVYLLGLVNVQSSSSPTASGDNIEKSATNAKEDAAEIEASIQEEMKNGNFKSKEAYFSAELAKQSLDVDDELVEFSKKIMSTTSKMNITGLVVAKKMDQITKLKSLNGFGVELVKAGDESDDFKLISHLKGQTSSVEFFAEGGRVVAHFKDYPASYCAGTKGIAVCGS
ncbi:MAG TPA: hypothetical protein DGG95_04800 [Cytophagales bacterium]|nr:hypothetical protein [Cytophagales bacterium]